MNMELLKIKRKEANLTQSDMAQYFNYSRQAYQQKEGSKLNFKLSEIRELKKILNLTNDEIYEIFID